MSVQIYSTTGNVRKFEACTFHKSLNILFNVLQDFLGEN